MDWYPWVVIAHVFTVIIAFGAHGVSAFAMFQIRRETDRARLAAILDLSATSLYTAGIALLVAVAFGILAAIMGGHFARLWPWVAIVVTAAVFGGMTPLAAIPMSEVRRAVGIQVRGDKPTDPPKAPASDAELAAAKARLRPELVAGIGVVAIAVLVWLMEAKPF
jgi:hypothetical protein